MLELKTPLSSVRLRSEELLRSEAGLSDNARTELQEIETLGWVIDDLLVLSKPEAGVLKLDIKERDTGGFAEDFSEDAKVLCEDAGVTFQFENESSALACFDSIWILSYAVQSLVECVEVCFKRNGDSLGVSCHRIGLAVGVGGRRAWGE